MPDIYITNWNPEHDYSDARRYTGPDGQLIHMTKGYVDLKGAEQDYLAIFEQYFNSANEADMLLLSGPASLCALATLAWNRVFDGITLLYNVNERRNGRMVQIYQPARIEPAPAIVVEDHATE